MIIVRSPMRISLGGGGTDLPSYYRKYGGFLVAGAIDKYVYIAIHKTFVDDLIIKYSKMERVASIAEIQHPIVRESLKLTGVDIRNLEISSFADIPAGSGLGSSGSFTLALLKGLHTYKRNLVHPHELAAQACEIEIERLNEPIGKQDQYIASYGGITCFEFHPDDSVEAYPLNIDMETLFNLEDNLVLFFTSYTRFASKILEDQDNLSKNQDQQMIENLHFVKELGLRSKDFLEKGDIRGFADLMNVHWNYKKQRSQNISNDVIDEWYELGMNNGAIGGKLVGAGGGGFLMFYAEDKVSLRHSMHKAGLKEVRFRFDFEGTKVIV